MFVDIYIYKLVYIYILLNPWTMNDAIHLIY